MITLLPSQELYSCGVDPFPWLAGGTVLTLVGVVGYALASARYGRSSSSYARR